MADEPQTSEEELSKTPSDPPEASIREAVERMQLEPWYLDVRSEIVQPDQVVLQTRYFWDKWVPTLGPQCTMLFLRLRSHCYFNRRTGERRDDCYPSQETLGLELGLHRETVGLLLRRLELLGFIRRERQYRYDKATHRSVRTTDRYYVLMEDPLHPDDEAQAFVLAAQRIAAQHPKLNEVDQNSPKSGIPTYGQSPVDNTPLTSELPTNNAVGESDSRRSTLKEYNERNVGLDTRGPIGRDRATFHRGGGLAPSRHPLRGGYARRAKPMKKHLADVLPQIKVSPEKRDELLRVEDLAGQINQQLGDSHSKPFHRSVARGFAAAGLEHLIYQTLSEIREGTRDGRLHNPAAVFTARIMQLATAHGIQL
jgi:hypothetical protein